MRQDPQTLPQAQADAESWASKPKGPSKPVLSFPGPNYAGEEAIRTLLAWVSALD
jgi:hypothetical protein